MYRQDTVLYASQDLLPRPNPLLHNLDRPSDEKLKILSWKGLKLYGFFQRTPWKDLEEPWERLQRIGRE